ncbi:MAG TPA: acyl-CoA dehydrogenase family protein [Acidimicrobiales bacterium]|jgi:alkylation response protein AidB-like acyl-CoA dehydrogenase|nr:acyl-CoA dehydrogenase family protein [Acidimicrobiales bacterium]
MAKTDTVDAVTEVKEWLSSNWDPDLTVGEWWERFGTSGWAAPMLPPDAYGKGLSRAEAVRVQEAIADFGALPAPGGLGLLLAGPTIATHGTPEQVERYVKAIVTGQEAWCQLFSEPGAGSDLAGLTTKAEKDGDEWIITGQKVWTSGGQIADMGMLIARTNPEAPKHQGITYFAFDMKQPGVEVRPLREMTGRALFNEVFINEARVPDHAMIGGLNNGWAVANTTLAFERAGLGAGGGSAAASTAVPGTIAGDLGKRVGDMVRSRSRGGAGGPGGMGSQFKLLSALAEQTGAISDAGVRQDLTQLYTLTEIARYMGLRQKALRETGGDIPGMGNIAKLSMSIILRLTRDLGPRILGPRGMLHAYDNEGSDALSDLPGGPMGAGITEMVLFAQAPQIYGGTDQVQRNIIGERVLGLPKEPNNDKVTPFRDLPRN